MKYVLITNLYPPHGTGGAERVVEAQVRDFIQHGNEVVVITTSRIRKHEYYRNLKIIRFRPFNMYYYGDGYRHSFFMRLLWNVIDTLNIVNYFTVKRILKRERPDRAICHNLKGIGFFIPDILRALAIPYTQYLHDVQLVIPSGILKKGEEKKWINTGFLQKIYQGVIKRLLLSPKEVISPSKWLMNFYTSRRFFKHSKKTVVPFDWKGIDISAITAKLTAFKEKAKDGKRIQMLYVGKIEEHKGILWLLKVWKELPTPIELVIIGDGTQEWELKKSIAKNKAITFVGHKEHTELHEYYKRADILLMPTLCYENRPAVIVEAYQNGLPVLASNIGGIPEIVKVGETGLLFEAGDKESLFSTFGSKGGAVTPHQSHS